MLWCERGVWLVGRIWLGLSFFKWSSKRHSYVVENKTRRPRPLSTSTAMIMVLDRNYRNCRHRIVSALSLRSRRATGDLRRPSESRALLAFMARAMCCRCVGLEMRRSSCEIHNSMRRGRTEDPKTSAHIYGIRGLVPSPSRRRRRIPSTSFSLPKLT